MLLAAAIDLDAQSSLDIGYLLGVVRSTCIFNVYNYRILFTDFLGKVRLSHFSICPGISDCIGTSLTDTFDIVLGLPVVFFSVLVHDVGNMTSSVRLAKATIVLVTGAEVSIARRLNSSSDKLTLLVLSTSIGLLVLLHLWLLLWLLCLDLLPFTVHYQLNF